MANLALRVSQTGSGSFLLTPSRKEDIDTIERMHLKIGDELRANFKRARNPQHHRLVFALVNFVFDNQERFESPEALRAWLTLKTSFCHVYQDGATGAVLRVPRSWSFDEMDEDEFSRLHQELIPIVLREFMPGMDGDELTAAAAQHAYMEGVSTFA